MLHDTVTADRIVDSEAALEFMKEATKVASGTELENVGQRLEEKSRRFRQTLAPERIDELDEDRLRGLLSSIFSLKRKTGRLLRRNDLAALRGELGELLHGGGAVAPRFDRFVDRIQGFERAMVVALASEALHFTAPERYWLWTHWIWNPNTGTGALPLVTRGSVDLDAASAGGVYDKVGRAMAVVDAEGHAVGYSRSGRGLFGTDVFLACVYAVYMFTVFRVKLSQEFNRILPELPELVERVLGVRAHPKMGEADG